MPKFKRTSRMTDERAFFEVKRRGCSTRAGQIKVVANMGETKRLGIIVSRRVGNAVVRNRLKRVIREYFRDNQDMFPQGDCVVIPRPCSKAVSNEEIRADLFQALKKQHRNK